MEAGDSIFTQTPSSNFILLPSQDETQHTQGDSEILKKLPALQGTKGTVGSRSLVIPDGTSAEEEYKLGAQVLVPDSEVETNRADQPSAESSEAPVISESDDMSDAKEVTVIHRIDSDIDLLTGADQPGPPSACEPDHAGLVQQPGYTNNSNSSNGSSFKSHGKPGLGSYDQCELYGTQEGHARGQRFSLFQPSLSQDNIFSDEEKDLSERRVSTPSEHLGSFQLSSAPMLVPETVDDADSAIPPSVEAYGSTPVIIPGSPTEGEEEMDMDYDVNAVNTLSEYSRELRRGIRPGPTLAEDIPLESLHLHLTDSYSRQEKDTTVVQIDSERYNVEPSGLEYVTETPVKNPTRESVPVIPPPCPTFDEDEVIMIQSGTGETTQQDEDLDMLSLRLTLTQPTQSSRSSRSQKSQKSGHGHRRCNINDNPEVVWQEDSDVRGSTDFSLTLPKSGILFHPAIKRSTSVSDFGRVKSHSLGHGVGGQGQQDKQSSGNGRSGPKSPALTLGMINSQVEEANERIFQIEQPDVGAVEGSEVNGKKSDVFRRAKRRHQPQSRFHICDDSDDESSKQHVTASARRPTRQPDTETAKDSKTLVLSEAPIVGNDSSIPENFTGMEESTEPYDVPQNILDGETQQNTGNLKYFQSSRSEKSSQMTIPTLSQVCEQDHTAVSCHSLSESTNQWKMITADKKSVAGTKKNRRNIDRDVEEGKGTSPQPLCSPQADNDNPAVQTNTTIKLIGTCQSLKQVESHLRPENLNIMSEESSVPGRHTRRSGRFALAVSRARSSTRRLRSARQKRLATSVERNKRRRVSLQSAMSPLRGSGSFVTSTQFFRQNDSSVEPITPTSGTVGSSETRARDPYTFHCSQSHISPEDSCVSAQSPGQQSAISSSIEQTAVSSARRLQHRKSGINNVAHGGLTPPRHVRFQAANPETTSQHSDVTVTTICSIPSLSSSFGRSQNSPARSNMSLRVSPAISHTSSRRLSAEQVQSDTLPLCDSDEEKYRKEIVVIHRVKQFIETMTEVKIISPQGQLVDRFVTETKLLSCSQDKGAPVVMEERSHKKVQFISYPSPSRSVSTLTSGDYGDISSSLSRSSGSHGSKVSITSGRLDHSEAPAGSGDHTNTTSGNLYGIQTVDSINQVRLSFHKGKESTSCAKGSDGVGISNTTSTRSSVPTADITSTSGLNCGLSLRNEGTVRAEGNNGLLIAESGVGEVDGSKRKNSMRRAVACSDDEYDTASPHEASTINRTGSVLHSRTVSLESLKTSDSLFTTPEERSKSRSISVTDTKKKTSTDASEGIRNGGSQSDPGAKVMTSIKETRASRRTSAENSVSVQAAKKSDSGSYLISPETPRQDTSVQQESETRALVPSSGQTGSRVIARWKDGFFYPGMIKAREGNRCHIRFDDGDTTWVKSPDILLVEKLPAGQSVMVLTKEGDFESGMITAQHSTHYTVAADTGHTDQYTPSQVILTSDQAEILVVDTGSKVTMESAGIVVATGYVGDVCLDNLVEGSRRSSSKKPLDASKTGSYKGKKHKLSSIQPQATSTPTPKGKAEGVVKRRKVEEESSVIEAPSVGRRSPRKSRVGLFGGKGGSKPLFHDMVFLLTDVEKTLEQKSHDRKLLQDSSLEMSADESMEEDEASVPFNKEALVKMIEQGGGEVLDTFDQEKIKCARSCYMLSSSYQRTVKYLKALAIGIACVSHMWIVDSCKEVIYILIPSLIKMPLFATDGDLPHPIHELRAVKSQQSKGSAITVGMTYYVSMDDKDQLLDSKAYTLPAGISLEKKKLIECKGDKSVFKNIRAVVSSKKKNFFEEWSSLLTLAKGTALPKLQMPAKKAVKGSSLPDVIVTDDQCSASVMRQATQHGIPVVSTEWIVQSIITGRPAIYDAHPRYKHHYKQ